MILAIYLYILIMKGKSEIVGDRWSGWPEECYSVREGDA